MLGVSKQLCSAVYRDLELTYSLNLEKNMHLQAAIRSMQEYSPSDYALYKMRVLNKYSLQKISEIFGVERFQVIKACEFIRNYAQKILTQEGYYIKFKEDYARLHDRYGKHIKHVEPFIEIKITKDFSIKIRG